MTVESLEQQVAALPANSAVLLENMDSPHWPPLPERDRLLIALVERPSTTLLLTGHAPPTQWPVAMGDLRSRFDSLLALPMWELDETLLSALIRKHFADRQLDVPDAVVKRILTHVERTPEAVAALVARADRRSLAEQRAVSERLVLELIEAEEGNRRGH
jgi:chromosomal replication initiation ATPase DnaA